MPRQRTIPKEFRHERFAKPKKTRLHDAGDPDAVVVHPWRTSNSKDPFRSLRGLHEPSLPERTDYVLGDLARGRFRE